MDGKLLFAIVLLGSGVLCKEIFTCKNVTRNLWTKVCVIEDFNYDDLEDLSERSFPNATHLEFRNIYFPNFAGSMFELLPDDLQELTFREGYVREINLQLSLPLERLRVIHTDLVVLDTVSEPNFSMKEIAIRSPVFSRWSDGLQFLQALEVIDVAYCNFTFISLDWFESYERLKVLDVSQNRLQTIASRPELTLPSLKELFVWGNRLEFLWRFPDAFPKLELMNLSGNLWRCSWVDLARGAIYDRGITVIDSDYSCQTGWKLNGGLCCQSHEGSKSVRNLDAVIDYIVDETNGSVIGMRMENSVIYLDKPVGN